MAIKIGHAAGDELRRASGGKAGDQTGGEVCVRTWYSSPWDCVLRPLDGELAEKSAAACEAACANPHIGYDQQQRNTLYERALELDFRLGDIEEACECDCSSFMHVCALAGGADIPFKWNCLWTGNMLDGFLASGQYAALTEDKYLISDAYLKRGDILLNSRSHTAMALEDGTMVSDGGAPEENDTVGANPRPADKQDDGAVGRDDLGAMQISMLTALPLLKKGAKGEAVWTMQTLLSDRGYCTGGVDSDFGAKTDKALRAFQRATGLEADGECGALTWAELIGR